MSLCFVFYRRTRRHFHWENALSPTLHSQQKQKPNLSQANELKNETPKIHTLRLSYNQITDGKKKKMIGIINEKKKLQSYNWTNDNMCW